MFVDIASSRPLESHRLEPSDALERVEGYKPLESYRLFSSRLLKGYISLCVISLTIRVRHTCPFQPSTIRAARALVSGCFPAYVPGADYSSGDEVSQVTNTVSPTNWVACAGQDGCPITGYRQEGGVETTTRNNYECISNAWCGNPGFAPGNQYESQAWSKGAECTVSCLFFIFMS